MKTHIIHLEQDDNVISITDKLSWGKARRVLLVYPPPPLGLKLHKIELLLIKRAAIKMGFSIGIVSRSKGIKMLTDELDIPVFKSIKQSQRRTWAAVGSEIKKYHARKPLTEIRKMSLDAKTEEPKWKSLIGFRLFFFSIGVLAVLLISLLFIPSAKIKLNLSDQTQMTTLLVTADESVDVVNLTGVIPVHTKTVDVVGTRLATISSRTKVPDKYSVGKILFTNLTEMPIEIPLGTIVARLDNSGVRFETTERADVASGIGQIKEVPIRALTPGEVGNMEANSLGSLIGDLGTSLSAINPDPSYGGADRVTNMATQNDRNDLFSLLEADLRVEAIQSNQTLLSEGDIIFPDSVTISEILHEVYVPTAGQPGDRLSLDLKITYTMQYAENSDLLRLCEPALKADLPEGYESLSENSIKFDLLKRPTANSDGTTSLNLQANRKVKKEIDALNLSLLVQGLSKKEAYEILEEEYGPEIRPVVEISPSWWPWLPIVTMRIAVFN